MKKKITAIIAAAYIASALSLGAFAQSAPDDAGDGAGNILEQIGDGAGDIIEGAGDGIADAADGIGDAAGDVLDGAGSAVDDITGGSDEADEDDSLTEITDDDDVPDSDDPDDIIIDEDDDDDITEVTELSKNAAGTSRDNPATGVQFPLIAAAVIPVSAAVAYITKKRRF